MLVLFDCHVELEVFWARHVSTKHLLRLVSLTTDLSRHHALIVTGRCEILCGETVRESLQAGKDLDEDFISASYNDREHSCYPLSHDSTKTLRRICTS